MNTTFSTAAPTPARSDVRPLVLTPSALPALWTRLEEFPAARKQLRAETPDAFVATFTSPAHVFLDVDGGAVLVAALDLRPGEDATLVVVAWDHHLRGREDGIGLAIDGVMRMGRLRRITWPIPADLPVLAKCAARLGFAWEGVLREGFAPGIDLHVNGRLA